MVYNYNEGNLPFLYKIIFVFFLRLKNFMIEGKKLTSYLTTLAKLRAGQVKHTKKMP